MVDQEEVGNLELGSNLEVDNPEACIESVVDKDPEEYTEFGVLSLRLITLRYVLSLRLFSKIILSHSLS